MTYSQICLAYASKDQFPDLPGPISEQYNKSTYRYFTVYLCHHKDGVMEVETFCVAFNYNLSKLVIFWIWNISFCRISQELAI